MARIKLDGRTAVYHCISRVVGGERLLDDECKEMMAAMIWKLAGFCGLEIITYCIMSNHFHVLLRVPPQHDVSDSQLAARLESLYGPHGTLTVFARQAVSERGQVDADVRQALLERMGDVSAFMKELKQRFSRWYNRRNERFGTLWAERFKSVVVEDKPSSVEAVAAYIDLNPVRAGLVEDPKDYRFCGYAAALAGNKLARQGLMSIQRGNEVVNDNCVDAPPNINIEKVRSTAEKEIPRDPRSIKTEKQLRWPECAAAYRMRMFVRAGSVGQSGKTMLTKECIQKVLAQGGVLSLGEVLRLRVRHMTDGVALGTRGFVNEVFTLHREKFGPKRKDGARPVRILAAIGLNALRDLKVRTVG